MHRHTTQMTLFSDVSEPPTKVALPPFIASHTVSEVSVYRAELVHSTSVWRCYELCPLTLKPLIAKQGGGMRTYKKRQGTAWQGYDLKLRRLVAFELELRRRHGSRCFTLFRADIRTRRQQLLPRGWHVERVYVQPMLQYTFELFEPDAWITYLYDEETGSIKKIGGGIAALSNEQRKKVKNIVLGKFKMYIKKRDKHIEDERKRAHSLFPEPF